MPTISIVMPVYNCERYIQQAIDSILNQTYSDFEFIIVDDGSTDKTSEIIQNVRDKRICLVKNTKNRGIIASLNNGIKLSTGKYIARMDADDISLPTRLERQIDHLTKTNSDICGCHYFTISREGSIISKIDVPLNNNEIIMYLGVAVPFAHPSVLINKAFVENHNLRYGDSNYKIAEDMVLWHQMVSYNAKFSNVDEYLFMHRLHDKALTYTKKYKNLLDVKCLTKIYISNEYKIDLSTITTCSLRTQKIIVRSLLKALVYESDFSYFKNITKFKLSAFILGTLTGILGNDFLFKSIFTKN